MSDLFKINGREYEWADISLVVGGVSIVGFRKVSYKRSVEKEAMYAKGRRAHSIQSGNESVEGSISFTQSQLQALEAAVGDILLSSFDVIVCYGAELGSSDTTITTDVIKGVEFTEYEKSMSQGDKFMEIEMPFVALSING